MDIRLFYEFLVLAKTLNYHMASEKLQVSQSTLSRHIAELEHSFNLTLFSRDKYHVDLTRQGASFYDNALGIWTAFEEAQRAARSYAEPSQTYTLSGILEAPAFYPCVTKAELIVRNTAPDFSVILDKNSPSIKAQLSNIKSRDVTCASVFFGRPCVEGHPDLVAAPLCDVPMDVIVPVDDALAGRPSVTLAELADKRLVQFVGPQHSPVWRCIKKEFDDRGIPYRVKPTYAPSLYEVYSVLRKLDDGDALLIYRNYYESMRNPESDYRDNGAVSFVAVPISDFTLALDLIYLRSNSTPMMAVFAEALSSSLHSCFDKARKVSKP